MPAEKCVSVGENHNCSAFEVYLDAVKLHDTRAFAINTAHSLHTMSEKPCLRSRYAGSISAASGSFLFNIHCNASDHILALDHDSEVANLLAVDKTREVCILKQMTAPGQDLVLFAPPYFCRKPSNQHRCPHIGPSSRQISLRTKHCTSTLALLPGSVYGKGCGSGTLFSALGLTTLGGGAMVRSGVEQLGELYGC